QHFNNKAVDLPMQVLFDQWPPLKIVTQYEAPKREALNLDGIAWADAVNRVLSFPCVADKSFLITIGDRSVTALVARDQMIGPWQVPVADVAVTANDYFGFAGSALAMGERTPLALINPAASARMAVGEALTNIAASFIGNLAQVSLSANWMAAARYPGEAAALYDAVQTVGMELCPALGISIPVGKDSLSMSSRWQDQGKTIDSAAPLSLIISAAGSVKDIRKTLTPLLNVQASESCLLLIDLGRGRNALGASVLAQVYQLLGNESPDLDEAYLLKNFFNAIQALNAQNLMLAYHDRSDGGLLATLSEMMFASHVGLTVDLSGLGANPLAACFNEELGAVIQIKKNDLLRVQNLFKEFALAEYVHPVAELNTVDELIIKHNDQLLFSETRVNLHRVWSELSFRMQTMRDNPTCAEEQYDALLKVEDPGLNAKLSFDVQHKVEAPYLNLKTKPKVAILREQGVNGHIEMAAAFAKVGFDSVDVHMSDVQQGRVQLKDFVGLVACGGFSYGDVLGAGRGWAQSILLHSRARDEFSAFFNRKDTFSLGVCNGCQLFSQLKSIVPGTEHWPEFKRNLSEQFEARLSLVEVLESPSLFLQGMTGSVMPIVIAHGEGRVQFVKAEDQQQLIQKHQVSLRFVDSYHQRAVEYPANPNGSPEAITGLCNADGRVTIFMPHPERVVRASQFSWAPTEWGEESPWHRFFANARVFVG
ncbi:MAG TPA: phosphoribosylformylglycinamidine synthase, partial [Coxiellaceae bacterium]|nr:phosphoribosylformylglycinamidine synthase [Coxiellaceae bacterium]